MPKYIAHLFAINDDSLVATVEVTLINEMPLDEVGEIALEQEWLEGANWSNGEQFPETDGVYVTSVEKLSEVPAHSVSK